MARKNLTDLEQKALEIVRQEKASWEEGTAFVTDRVAFQMRNLIRTLRKNYWGIFDKPKDEITGRDKIWVPLTETLVEAVVKNIDLDTKDINIRAKKPSSRGLTILVRHMVKNFLDDIYFGEYLDELERQLAIDGTAVWKTFELKDGNEYKCEIRNVDLLNFYIDPLARSIAETPAVIERSLMTLSEFKSMTGWKNKENVEGSTTLYPVDAEVQFDHRGGQTKMVEVFERWGLLPKFYITGNEKDKEEVETHLVASAEGSNWRLHLIEENKTKKKPYEEAWYTRVPNRWYGRGIAEKVMMLQLWINIVVNVRINRSLVSQLGIFKVKRGSGITPQMLGKLAANGAIQVNSMDDIEQFVMQEASQSSYKDEEVIQDWAKKLTSAFEVVTGEGLPSSTPATNAAIQSRNAQSAFVLIKEGVGMFLQRWLKRHAMPIILKKYKLKDIIRLTDDTEILRKLDERIVNELLYKQLKDTQGFYDPVQIELARQSALQKLNTDKERYFELLNEIDLTEYDVQVYVTNEEIDKNVLATNLINVLSVAPEYRQQVLEQLFDLVGLEFNAQQLPAQAGQPMGQINPQTLQGVTTNALTGQGNNGNIV